MRILQIEIDGFKSYGQPQKLEKLDAQFNAITGLNGSGKSNILDSICFLLGISNLQYVRAENNEDLVFKKGQGGITKATVTITFDNSDPKHRPIGYEADKTIVVRRQIVLNGKQTYHINNMPASATKVSELFCSCSMNVNNPHFLIMQGRVTKVLNMKPREILLMIEEAAGVRVYENKRRTALNTIEKKSTKIENMNKMMDEEILPRLNKLRGERELYNEYQKLGRDIEEHERLIICFEYWSLDSTAKNYREAISVLIRENEESKTEIAQLEEQLETENNTLREAKTRLEGDLKERMTELQEIRKKREEDFVKRDAEFSQKNEMIKELDSNIDTKRKDIKQDKNRLEKKKADLASTENSHGGKAKQMEEAEKKLEQCKATLAALERGLVISEEGQEVSMEEQILALKTKHGQEQTKASRFKSALADCRPKLRTLEEEFAKIPARGTSNSLDVKLKEFQTQLEHINTKLEKFKNLNHERDTCTSQLNGTHAKLRQMNDKGSDFYGRYPFLNFKYHPINGFNDDNVVGPFARLIRPKKMEYATALEVALGGILTNIVVKTRNAAKILLDKGNLERRVTFIPLDNLKFTPLKTCQLDRAIELVGRENVSLAVDLVDFDESNRNAVEYALGNTLVCTTPDAAKAVCFDRGIRTRVVTFEGDDYRPDGFLTGGSNQRRSSILSDIQTFLQIQQDINKLNQDSKSINDQLINIQERQKEKNQLELKRSDLTNEIRQIEGQIRADPSINLSEKIEKLKAEIKKNEDELEQIGPVVEELAEKLRVIEDRQRNEVAYRKKERKKAEDGLKEAESMMKELSTNSVNMIKKLELDKLEVETLEMQILGDEEDLRKQEQNRCLTIGERDAIKENVKELKRLLDEIKDELSEFNRDYREVEKDIRQKSSLVEDLRKNLRDRKQEQENFEPKRRDLIKKAEDHEKRADMEERKHSWIKEEKENFNKAGTIYDFRGRTKRDYLHDITGFKDRREELERRVNINAMKSLAEEEERAVDLDNKRKALQDDRDLLNKTIFEIDEEKKRELEASYRKISRDFGAIFSTILPGANAKLQAVDESELTNGLQIRVAFNDQWKESLDELSGGQRSLVALSLILAMLKCNPAPIYILDEVDAALDLSHTSNIGTMIKQHFKESQFIIVSLKEGMFNNANVIYRTQFVNGTSKVVRTAN